MAESASAGARIYIGPITPCSTVEAYEALSWVEIEGVETIGEYGDQAEVIRFTALKDARTRKHKGPKDAGDLQIIVGADPRDAGQLALIAAEATKFSYAFKIVTADAPDANDTDSVDYFHAKVTSKRKNIGGASDVTKRTFILGIDAEILEDPSAAVS